MCPRIPAAAVAVLIAITISSAAHPAFGQAGCGEWSPVPAPAAATRAILDIAALSSEDAWAVSSASPPIHWNGAEWAVEPFPSLGGQASLDAVAATSATTYALAGFVVTGTWTTEQILVTGDAGGWSEVATLELVPNIMGAPRHGAPRDLDGVGPDDVWIVGTADGFGDAASGSGVLTVHWDGSELTEYITPPMGNRQNHLYGVTTLAPNDAWAVGYYNTSGTTGIFRPMIYHWDGSTWTSVPIGAENLPQTFLHTVDAVAPDDIWAAGNDANGPFFMHYDGTAWSIVPGPDVLGTIHHLVAIAGDDAWAVDSPWLITEHSKYYHWDGTAWSVVMPPVIPGSVTTSRHGGLAAVGPCDVWATGSLSDGSSVSPFIERLQGGGSSTTGAPLVSSGPAPLHAYPNPMRSTVRITFAAPGLAARSARIHDVTGRRVRDLEAGANAFEWDGRDDFGRRVPGGVYLVRVESLDGSRATGKLTVVR